MRRFFVLPALAGLALLSAACEGVRDAEAPSPAAEASECVSVDEALGNLRDFLGATRSAVDVDEVLEYRPDDGPDTRSAASRPTAYVVNFRGGGFAVLGAVRGMSPVVAVVRGRRMDARLCVGSVRVDAGVPSAPVYVPEDDDYVAFDSDPSEFVSDLVRNGADRRDSGRPSARAGGYAVVGPMLDYSWGQGKYGRSVMWNRYCRSKVMFRSGVRWVRTGCGPTALAMAVQYNRFPDLYINGRRHPFDLMAGAYRERFREISSVWNDIDPAAVDGDYNEHASDLIASVFHNVRKSVWKGGTGTTCTALSAWMKDAGYPSVRVVRSFSWNSSTSAAVSGMLAAGRPVVLSMCYRLCDMGDGGFAPGHIWVVDGGRYSGKDWLVHCNWGFDGELDGWFSTSCMGIFDGEEYDDEAQALIAAGKTARQKRVERFTWAPRILTYSVPAVRPVVRMDYRMP